MRKLSDGLQRMQKSPGSECRGEFGAENLDRHFSVAADVFGEVYGVPAALAFPFQP